MPRGRIFASVTVGARPATVSISNRSISRRAPTMPEAHAGRRAILALEDAPSVRDARAPSVTRISEDAGAASLLTQELDLPAARVLEGVAGDLRDGGGDAGLVLGVEAEQAGDLPGALAGQDDVGLEADRDRQERQAHESPRRSRHDARSRRRGPARKSR